MMPSQLMYHFPYANIIILSSVKNYYLNNKHCESNLVLLLQEVVKENLTPLQHQTPKLFSKIYSSIRLTPVKCLTTNMQSKCTNCLISANQRLNS